MEAPTVIEQIAFLNVLDSKLTTLVETNVPLPHTLILSLVVLGFIGLVSALYFGSEKPIVPSIISIFASAVFIHFVPVQNSVVLKTADIVAAYKEVPPHHVLSAWGVDASKKTPIVALSGMGWTTYTAEVRSYQSEIRGERYRLESKLAFQEFKESGGLDELKKKVISEAKLEREAGTANAYQLALLKEAGL